MGSTLLMDSRLNQQHVGIPHTYFWPHVKERKISKLVTKETETRFCGWAICSQEFLSSFEPELGYIAAKIRFKVDHPYEHSKIIKLNAAKLELDLIYLFPMQDNTKVEFRGNSLDTEYFIIKSVDLLLVLANEFDLRRRQMPNLLANDMKVRLPRRKENV